MNTDLDNGLAREVDALIEAFFRDTTASEFAQFLKEIDADHYQTIRDDVFGQQIGVEKFAWQMVEAPIDSESLTQGFSALLEDPETFVPRAADYQDLALAA
jgi:hypothetical protein